MKDCRRKVSFAGKKKTETIVSNKNGRISQFLSRNNLLWKLVEPLKWRAARSFPPPKYSFGVAFKCKETIPHLFYKPAFVLKYGKVASLHHCRTGEKATVSYLVNSSVKVTNSEFFRNNGASFTKFMPVSLKDYFCLSWLFWPASTGQQRKAGVPWEVTLWAAPLPHF